MSGSDLRERAIGDGRPVETGSVLFPTYSPETLALDGAVGEWEHCDGSFEVGIPHCMAVSISLRTLSARIPPRDDFRSTEPGTRKARVCGSSRADRVDRRAVGTGNG